jgi:hypothetical protein
MAATVLNSPRAVAMSLYIIRAFVKLREALATNVAIVLLTRGNGKVQSATVALASCQLATQPTTSRRYR